MKFLLLLALAATTAFARPSGRLAPLIIPPDAETIPGEYMVMLKDLPSESQAVVSSVIGRLNVKPEVVVHMYQNGFAARLDEIEVQELRFSTDVDYIEQNSVVHATGLQKDPANWGLDRISQRNLPLNGEYKYPDTAGEGVDVYVIDTGVYIEHDDFEGRAEWGFTANPSYPNRDGNGHGTHVASTIVGKEHGVAKKAKVFAVKVLSDYGSGSMADVVAGVEYVTEQVRTGKSKKAVANMSLGGGRSPSLDNAVEKSIANGVTFAVAAGNNNGDACRISPAGAPSPITVGASTKEDVRASFSNKGRCVDLFGPGHLITAAWINGKSDTKTISGTSMASPHAAGVAALVLGAQSKVLSPKEVKNAVIEATSQGKLTDIPSDTVNKLLFVDLEDTRVGIDGGNVRAWGELVF